MSLILDFHGLAEGLRVLKRIENNMRFILKKALVLFMLLLIP
jgi:hypothetical protein